MVAITFKEKPMTVLGNEVKIGDKAPDFKVLANDLSEVTLADSKNRVRLISVIPSIDTGVCDAQTRKFNEAVGEVGNVDVLTISVDLPFAQRRWCAASGLDHVKTLSDHKDLSFGTAYGLVLEELRLLARAVFVVDSNDTIVHAEYVSEATNHPDYEQAIEAAKKAN
ncbi:thiol peroxidase [Alkalicoccobacillus porphyridii]|uniref:Thiol peroxidase n=1 Tax=Alkalicoccobacillus porphyridii TaxID=2597270 RepID=A0A554A2Y7_9BACI|nr:thiol peroxidase [Alkalicoccobacillus porphyridii]TSB48057.1 thiol peroxidase [Alkalicoccobacillus porphyridii]